MEVISGDFKLSVITYMRKNHLSLFKTAIKFGIPRDWTVNQWDRIYTKKGVEGLYRNNRGKINKSKKRKPRSIISKSSISTQEELLAELEYLRTENAHLKKIRGLSRGTHRPRE